MQCQVRGACRNIWCDIRHTHPSAIDLCIDAPNLQSLTEMLTAFQSFHGSIGSVDVQSANLQLGSQDTFFDRHWSLRFIAECGCPSILPVEDCFVPVAPLHREIEPVQQMHWLNL